MSLFSGNIGKSGLIRPLVGEVTPNPHSRDRKHTEGGDRKKKKKKSPGESGENLPPKTVGRDLDRYV